MGGNRAFNIRAKMKPVNVQGMRPVGPAGHHPVRQVIRNGLRDTRCAVSHPRHHLQPLAKTKLPRRKKFRHLNWQKVIDKEVNTDASRF